MIYLAIIKIHVYELMREFLVRDRHNSTPHTVESYACVESYFKSVDNWSVFVNSELKTALGST